MGYFEFEINYKNDTSAIKGNILKFRLEYDGDGCLQRKTCNIYETEIKVAYNRKLHSSCFRTNYRPTEINDLG